MKSAVIKLLIKHSALITRVELPFTCGDANQHRMQICSGFKNNNPQA